MKATLLYGPRDVRCGDKAEPKIQKPTDAIIRLSATCICGSDLWPFRGLNPVNAPMAMGHSSLFRRGTETIPKMKNSRVPTVAFTRVEMAAMRLQRASG